jgi:hypothetical protein
MRVLLIADRSTLNRWRLGADARELLQSWADQGWLHAADIAD